MIAITELKGLGHPTLRAIAEPVPEEWFGSGRLADLGRDMVRTMLEEHGVGLAAPQVAEGIRLFTYWVPGTDDESEIPPVTPLLCNRAVAVTVAVPVATPVTLPRL